MVEDTPASDLHPKDWATDAAISQAVQTLNAGDLVAFPTETVYGLGADATNPTAIARLFALKGRPANHPVIVHLARDADLTYWISGSLPTQAQALIDAFWPGPLTLILKRAEHIPAAVSGGQLSIGLRCPAHPVAQSLLRALESSTHTPRGLAAPSANRFGRVSPTAAQHVRDEFGAAVPVLEGGACAVGIESTILDLSRGYPVLLRAGQLSAARLAEVLGELPQLPNQPQATQPQATQAQTANGAQHAATPRVSGTLAAHYAPRIPLLLLDASEIAAELAQRIQDERIALIAREPTKWMAFSNLTVVAAPDEPHSYAHDLYRLLRQLENTDVQRIFVEQPPATLAWVAINDRLGRAAAAFKKNVRSDS